MNLKLGGSKMISNTTSNPITSSVDRDNITPEVDLEPLIRENIDYKAFSFSSSPQWNLIIFLFLIFYPSDKYAIVGPSIDKFCKKVGIRPPCESS